jgi:uncharacterized protein (TIGR02186 family)
MVTEMPEPAARYDSIPPALWAIALCALAPFPIAAVAYGWGPADIAAPAEQRIETRYGVRDVVVSVLGSDYYDWKSAVVRLKEAAGLYREDEHGVRFVDRGLFRAEIALPAAAPTGVYRADIILFQNGKPVAQRTRTLTVRKAGAERALYVWAHERPWSYGLASMAFALAVGWAASAAFRRD